MKISTNHEQLFGCLEYVISVIPPARVDPILSHVLIRASDKNITMIGTNHEVQITASCEGKVTGGEFERIVPADKLRRMLSTFSSDTAIKMEFSETEVKITAARSSFRLMTQKTDRFSLLGKTAEKKELENFSNEVLLEALHKVQYASAEESHRRSLNGVFFQRSNEGINFVGTDGHRMVVKTIKKKCRGSSAHIVPVKTVQILSRHLGSGGETKVSANDRVICFQTDKFELISNVIQETYPDYQHVIPRNNEHQAVVERATLKTALERVIALSDNNAIAHMEFDANKLSITSNNSDNDSLTEDLDVKYDSEKIKLVLNAVYLTQFLNVCKEQMVEINMSTPENSVLIRPMEEGEQTVNYVVMPIRT